MTELEATADDAGLRLDVWLHRKLPDLSRARLQALIRDGHVSVAGRTLTPHHKVSAGLRAEVQIPPPCPARPLPEPIDIDILHEDEAVLILNKPAGLVVHPAAGHPTGTLVNALLHHCRDLQGIGGEKRPGIVHRLDKDTSGVMVVAKHERALHALVEQFRQGSVRKEYLALVAGQPRPGTGRIETLIGRSRRDRKKMSASPTSGRTAVTHYRMIEPLGEASLLEVRIQTGRTHQIRVHMAHIGHPVIGDRQYGRGAALPCLRKTRAAAGHGGAPPAVPRQMLHSAVLGITHPCTGQHLVCRAPLPGDMRALLDGLRTYRTDHR